MNAAADDEAPLPRATHAGEGERVDMGAASFTLRSTTDQTGGRYTLIESRQAEVGDGPGLHLHTREEETFIVLAGRYRFVVGDDEVMGEPGAVVFTPLNTPHRFEMAEPGSQLLHLFTPGGIDDYFRRSWKAIEEGRLEQLAAEFGVRFL